MRYSIALPVDHVDFADEFCTGEAVAEIAAAADRLGYHMVYTTEHPVPERKWLESGGHHALDPFVTLGFAAAATQRVRLLTNLIVLSYRSPFVTAKAATTLDRLSAGRLTMGVGAGYLEAEFRALGVDFERRNEATDEALRAMKLSWSGELHGVPAADGSTTENRSLPLPIQRPHPPIWMGGNSKMAIRRAVEHCQGWMPIPAPPKMASRVRTASIVSAEDLTKRLDYLGAYAKQLGREEPLDILFMSLLGQISGHNLNPQQQLDEAAHFASLGVTDMHAPIAKLGGQDPKTRFEYIERMAVFASEVIAKTD